MKIAMAHVDLPNESKGGVAMQAHLMANALVKAGHEVTMYTFSERFSECNYAVNTLPVIPKLRKFQSFLFAKKLSEQQFHSYDIVHTHGDNYLLGKVHPQVRTMHGSASWERRTAKTARRKAYQTIMQKLETRGSRIADVCVGVSENTRQDVPAVSFVIPNGVDLNLFYPGKKTTQPTVLFVGTVGGRKRGNLLLEIFNKRIKPYFPNAELWSVADAPMHGDGVVNCGRVSTDELCRLYRESWIFCLPSTYEGFGVPYIEAMASGTPVVATPNAGSCEVLSNGQYGILAQEDQLGQSICDLITDASRRKVLTETGIERAKIYSWPTIIAQYESVYQSLVTPTKVKSL